MENENKTLLDREKRLTYVKGSEILGEEKETRKNLKESAEAEFLEKGYLKSSLRRICASAGVTTGALYFFFRDKEALFGAIVEPPLEELKELLLVHFNTERKSLSSSATYYHIEGDHNDFSAMLVHHIYTNRSAFILLLTKSQGSRFENCVDGMVDMVEKNYLVVAEKMARAAPGKHINTYMLHWLAHMIIDAFIHLITHEQNEKKALVIISRIMDSLVGSWMELVLED